MNLNVAYSSDDRYAQHVGVSMVSLFENNKDFNNIQVYLIENEISLTNKLNLISICEKYDRSINFVSFDEVRKKLKVEIGNSISISSYARLFLSSVLEGLDKILYLDCDSIIKSTLRDLWNININDFYVAGVLDTVSENTKLSINIHPNSPYINAGMLLINLKKWNEEEIEKRFIDFIDTFNGKVFHHDQGTINGTLNKKMLVLHPKYNSMTTFFTMRREQIMKYYGMSNYYSEVELSEAVNNPVFIHFTPAFVNRPWVVGSKHPLTETYLYYLDRTPWKGTKRIEDARPIGEKLISYLYTHLPFNIANGICKLVFK